MKDSLLTSYEIGAFCEGLASMLAVGIQTEEAIYLIADGEEFGLLKVASNEVYSALVAGSTLSDAMQQTGMFPAYVINTLQTAESTGYIEGALRSLALYYTEEDRLFTKVRTSIAYPTVLLCFMSVILAFTVTAILPVFFGVYESLAGGLTTGSFGALDISVVIGWVSLAIVVLFTLWALVALIASKKPSGRDVLIRLGERMPFTRAAFANLALSRFTSILAVQVASGVNTDEAMRIAQTNVEHKDIRARTALAYASMVEPVLPRSLTQALAEFNVYTPEEIRTLTFSMRTGSLDEALEKMSADFFVRAIEGLDKLIDTIEPLLTAFLTLAVAATLVSVMLPLVGIMGSIG